MNFIEEAIEHEPNFKNAEDQVIAKRMHQIIHNKPRSFDTYLRELFVSMRGEENHEDHSEGSAAKE